MPKRHRFLVNRIDFFVALFSCLLFKWICFFLKIVEELFPSVKHALLYLEKQGVPMNPFFVDKGCFKRQHLFGSSFSVSVGYHSPIIVYRLHMTYMRCYTSSSPPCGLGLSHSPMIPIWLIRSQTQ